MCTAWNSPLSLIRSAKPIRLIHGSFSDKLFAVFKPISIPFYSRSQLASGCFTDGNDVEDCLASRVLDSLPQGAVPFFPSLFRSDQSRFLRGAVLVVNSERDSAFLSQCSELGAVTRTYSMLCHVPKCVDSILCPAQQHGEDVEFSHSNPFVVQEVHRRVQAEQLAARLASVPKCIDVDPLLLKLFYNGARLRESGSVSIFVGPRSKETANSRQLRRIASLFTTSVNEQAHGETFLEEEEEAQPGSKCNVAGCHCCRSDQQPLLVREHPWSFSKDPLVIFPQTSSVPGKFLKNVSFKFRLVRHDAVAGLAMFEVSTLQALEKHLRLIFAASGLPVLNDFEFDAKCANQFLQKYGQHHHETKKTNRNFHHQLGDSFPHERFAKDVSANPNLLGQAMCLKQISFPNLDSVNNQNILRQLVTIHTVRPIVDVANQGNHLTQHFELNSVDCGDVDSFLRYFHHWSMRNERGDFHQDRNVPETQHRLESGKEETDEKFSSSQRTEVEEGKIEEKKNVNVAHQPLNELHDEVRNFPLSSSLPFHQSEMKLGDDPSNIASLKMSVLRSEEVSTFVCCHCGSHTHPVSMCPKLVQKSLMETSSHEHLLPDAESNKIAPDESTELTQRVVTPPSTAPPSKISGTPIFALVSSKQSSSLYPELEELKKMVTSRDFGAENFLGNQRPTNSPRYQQYRQTDKPKIHRTDRCAYCQGLHPITECPKLPSGTKQTSSKLITKEIEAQAAQDPKALFCIACAEFGHWYGKCPMLRGVPQYNQCRVCCKPNPGHEPEQCPARVESPRGYSAHGLRWDILRNKLQSERATAPPKDEFSRRSSYQRQPRRKPLFYEVNDS